MDKLSTLKGNMKQLIGVQPNLPIHAVVKSIDGDKCSVEIDGFELTEIRLKSTTGGDNRLILEPKIGSDVTLLSSDGTIDNLVVIKMDRIEKVSWIENDFKVLIDADKKKVGFGNGQTDIYEVFEKLTKLLKQFKVYTPAGPSGTPLPDTIQRIEAFEDDYKAILKSI